MTKPDLFKKYKLPKALGVIRLPDAPEPTRLKYEIYGKPRDWRWRLLALYLFGYGLC